MTIGSLTRNRAQRKPRSGRHARPAERSEPKAGRETAAARSCSGARGGRVRAAGHGCDNGVRLWRRDGSGAEGPAVAARWLARTRPCAPTAAAKWCTRGGVVAFLRPAGMCGYTGRIVTLGLWLAIAAGLLLGVYQVFHRKAGQQLGVMRGMALLLVGCVVVASVILVLTIRPLSAIRLTGIAVFHFAAAGVFHFICGFTFLTISQHRVGATRTGVLVGSTPLFATVVGFLVLGEVLAWLTVAGIVLMVAGVVVVSKREAADVPVVTERPGGITAPAATDKPSSPAVPTETTYSKLGASVFGLLSAFSFSLSAVFIRMGLNSGTAPIVGLWVGLVVAAILFLPWARRAARRGESKRGSIDARTIVFEVAAATFITIGMWLRYVATQTVPVGVVTALARLNIPLILIVSPLFLRTKKDAATLRLWMGSILIIGGATLIMMGP